MPISRFTSCSAAARSLVAHATRLPPGDRPLAQRISGIDLEIAPIHVQPSPVLRGSDDTEPLGSATVRIELEPFDGSGATVADIFSALFTTERAAPLLRVKPSGDSVDMADEWLRRTCRRLGLAAPAAQPISALDSAMAEASRRAVQGLPRIRQRLEAGLPDGQICVIKVGLETAHGDKEFVWVRVTEWSSDGFVGPLEVQPNDCPGYTLGQTMRVADTDVFDCAIVNPTAGPVEPALTDVVAQDFGVDLPG